MSSIKYNNVYIKDYYSIGGYLESEGKINNYDDIMDDYYYETNSIEEAELKIQKNVLDNLLFRNCYKEKDIFAVVGGELSNQITMSSYNMRNYNIPFLGIYSACSTFTEGLLIGGLLLNKRNSRVITLTSSHNLNAEKQFRFPIEYGAIKKKYTTFTTTGGAGVVLSKEVSKIKLESSTIGRVIDMGVSDVFYMGAVMAPAAVDTLMLHLNEMNRDINYYDLIITGDLGSIGEDIFKEYLYDVYKKRIKNYVDAGSNIYKKNKKTFTGGSGPVVLPLYLFNNVFKKMKNKKVLLLGTGSLHSPLMVNQKYSIPAICHAVSLEVGK